MKIDRWFLAQIKELVDFEGELAGQRTGNGLRKIWNRINFFVKLSVAKEKQFATDAKRIGIMLDLEACEPFREAGSHCCIARKKHH